MNESKKMILEDQLVGCYTALVQTAYQVSAPRSDIRKLHAGFLSLTKRWADSELQMLGESKDLTNQKHRAVLEFEKLVAARDDAPASSKRPGVCLMCGAPLTVACYSDELICMHCAKPVIDALDDLVRASTNRYTPQELMRIWKSLREAFDERRGQAT